MSDRPDQCTRMVQLPAGFSFEPGLCRCSLRYGHDGAHRGLLDGRVAESEVQQFDDDSVIFRGFIDVGLTWESKDSP